MYTIPGKDKKYVQSNESPLLGNIQASRNIDFTKQGYAQLAQRTKYIVQAGSNGTVTSTIGSGELSFNDVISMLYNPSSATYSIITRDGSIFDINPDFAGDSPISGTFARDAGSNKPTTNDTSDAVMFNSKMYVSWDTAISSRANLTWTASVITGLTSGKPHPLAVFENLNYLAVGDGNTVKLYDTSNSLISTCTIPAQFEVRWMRYLNNNLYIGTRNLSNYQALMFVWSGSGSTADGGGFPAYGANWFLSGCVYRSSMAVVTNLGQVLVFNGGGFDVLDNFPIYYTPYEWFENWTLDSVMCQRGMVAQGEYLLINVSNTLVLQSPWFLDKMPSGIWQYNPKVGLYHKYSLSGYNDTSTDFGQPMLGRAGAITLLAKQVANTTGPAVTLGSGLLWGARHYLTGASVTSTYSLGSITTGANRGMIRTSRLLSTGLKDNFTEVVVTTKDLFDADDKIIFKYRTTDSNTLPTPSMVSSSSSNPITFTSTTTFTTASTNFANVAVGNEILVLNGKGAGYTAHVSAISYSNPTYTVTLNEAITPVVNGNTAACMVTNFKYLGALTSSDPDGFKKFAVGEVSDFIEVQAEIRGEGIGIQDIYIKNTPNLPI